MREASLGTNSSIYVIGVSTSSVAKIGKAVSPAHRLMGIQVGNPERLALRWTTPGGYELESWLHNEFRHLRLLGEWFDFGSLDPVNEVKNAVERYHGETRFKPNELGCRLLRPDEHGRSPDRFAFVCSGACGNNWTCFN
jgi:hypothetical protein